MDTFWWVLALDTVLAWLARSRHPCLGALWVQWLCRHSVLIQTQLALPASCLPAAAAGPSREPAVSLLTGFCGRSIISSATPPTSLPPCTASAVQKRVVRAASIHGMARMAAYMACTYKAYLGEGLGPLEGEHAYSSSWEGAYRVVGGGCGGQGGGRACQGALQGAGWG